MSHLPVNRMRSHGIRIAAEVLGVLNRPITLERGCWGAVWAIRLLLAAVLILAGVAKLVSPGELAPTLKANHVPQQIIPIVTVLIAAVEIVVATSLIVARSGTRPLLIPALLFFAFALQLTYLLSQNVQSCNCLSGLIRYESSKEIMRLQILVNVTVAVLCAALGVWNPTMAKGASDGTARTHAA